VYKVFGYIKDEGDAGMPVLDVAKTEGSTTEAATSAPKLCTELLAKKTSNIFITLCAPPAFFRVGHFSYCALEVNVCQTSESFELKRVKLLT
jgi:hypothetical protein